MKESAASVGYGVMCVVVLTLMRLLVLTLATLMCVLALTLATLMCVLVLTLLCVCLS